ncbi:Helix-turn-helix domain protein [compost metagenome]
MERLFKIKEVMDILQLSYATVYVMCNNGTLPSCKVGGSIRIPKESLRNFIFNNTTGGNVNDSQQ